MCPPAQMPGSPRAKIPTKGSDTPQAHSPRGYMTTQGPPQKTDLQTTLLPPRTPHYVCPPEALHHPPPPTGDPLRAPQL